jgi:hypothetical protein
LSIEVKLALCIILCSSISHALSLKEGRKTQARVRFDLAMQQICSPFVLQFRNLRVRNAHSTGHDNDARLELILPECEATRGMEVQRQVGPGMTSMPLHGFGHQVNRSGHFVAGVVPSHTVYISNRVAADIDTLWTQPDKLFAEGHLSDILEMPVQFIVRGQQR